MAITFVGRTSALSPSAGTPVGTALTITLPGGIAAADVILLCVQASPSKTVTPPAGWTQLGSPVFAGGAVDYRVFAKAATGGEGGSQVFTVTASSTYPWTVLVYRGAAPTTYTFVSNNSDASVTSWTSPTYSAVVESWVASFFRNGNAGITAKDAGSTTRSASLNSIDIAAFDRITGPGTTSGTTVTTTAQPMGAASVGLRPVNSPPFGPTQNGPSSGVVIDVDSTQRFLWTFRDPDEDLPRPEGQSAYELRYKVDGAPSWTTVSPAPSTNQYHDFAPGTFTTATEYLWEIRTKDLAGEWGPWAGSDFFNGGTAPAAPSITDPTTNEVIEANSFDVDWTVSVQTAYQIRTVADNAGSPDTTVVYYDSGTIGDSAARTATVPFATNDRFEHVQVRVWDGTLWSAWASVRIEVAYTPPPAPVVTLSVDTALAAIVIDYDTPAPVGAEPTPTYVDIWIDDGGDIGDERKAAGLPIDGSWSFMTPRSSRDYAPHIRVIAYTADGIPSE